MGLFKSSSNSKSQKARAIAESSSTPDPPTYADSRSHLKSSSFSNSIPSPSHPSKAGSRGSSLSMNPKEIDKIAKKSVQQNKRKSKNGSNTATSPIITDSRGRVGTLYAPRESEMERRRLELATEAQRGDFDQDGEPWIGDAQGRERIKRYNKTQKPPPGQGPCQTM